MEIPDGDKRRVVGLLNNFLADELVLNAKTRNYAWNISGSHVHDLHIVLRDQRQMIIRSMDRLAKHIFGFGGKTAGILGEGLKRTRLDLRQNNPEEALEMIEDLLSCQRKLAHHLKRDSKEHRDLLAAAKLDDFAADLHQQDREMIATLEAIRKGRLHLRKD